ncbi:MAG: MobA/MobL family protein [Acetobacteraceae bacterium]|nr:MobA/MobL family protein [Acetobacteraceae bacterium]
MARVFELSTHVQTVSRGDGRSATAAAAYRACCAIEDERQNRTHDYTRKQGLEAAEIVLPDGAPAWARDRAKLWNAAELRERNKDKRAKTPDKANAQTAREFFFSFPVELSPEGRLNTARAVARRLADAHGIAADFAIHQPGKEGDERNYHCHMLTTTRRLTAKGLGEKAREWDHLKTGPRLVKDLRAFIADALNAELKAEGKAGLVHVEHRSFKDRGSPQRPTVHQGPGKTNVLRKRLGRARRAWETEQQAAQRFQHQQETAGLKVRQDFTLQAKAGQLAERERAGLAAIRAEQDAARQADRARAETGIRGAFRTFTGRAGREAFEREARDAQRVEAARVKEAALRGEISRERAALIEGQAKERGELTERHRREDGQLQAAFQHRHQMDRMAEAQSRREQVQGREQQRDRDHDRDPDRGGRSIGQELGPG